MKHPVIEKSLCSKCGKCVLVCHLDIITQKPGEFPTVNTNNWCNACGHCEAVCANRAISRFNILSDDKLEKQITPQQMRYFLLKKRSSRTFTSQQIDDKLLTRLIDTASMAPSAINGQERSFIIITDISSINKLRQKVLKHLKKQRPFLKLMGSSIFSVFLPKDTVTHFKNLLTDFDIAINKTESGKDYIFNNAACLVLFTGIGADPFGKDNALAAMHYLMIQAEAEGLSSCINGYLQSAPNLIKSMAKLPPLHKVFGAITLGYSDIVYHSGVLRKQPVTINI
ncbi:MAG: nitroreductase family protein [Spirochaetes bacterium]|nr:nitroreductase family protein [Spirochaetota bacterium]MBN2769470.1 nitroreductase family protein [Spirochaetota bacterium]